MNFCLAPAISGLCGQAVCLLAKLFPGLALTLLTQCSLQQAEYVLVKLVDGRTVLLAVQAYSQTQSPVTIAGSAGSFRTSQSFRSERRQSESDVSQPLRMFTLFLRKYAYQPSLDSFAVIPAMPDHLPQQICDALDGLQLVDQGASWKAFNAAHFLKRGRLMHLYGTAKLMVLQHQLLEASPQAALLPILLIQAAEIVFLCGIKYWMYPALLSLFMLGSIATYSHTLRQQHDKLQRLATANMQKVLPIVDRGWVRAISMHRLLPGDVLVLHSGPACCDMVLLRGVCLVEEFSLSGEAAQVRKVRYAPKEGVQYDPDTFHGCTIYSGTHVQQVWSQDDSDDEVLVMVVRTGWNTAAGSMLREVVASSRPPVENMSLVQDIFRLYGFSLVMQFIMFITYVTKAQTFSQSALDVVLRVLGTLSRAAPAGLPSVIVFLAAVARHRLGREDLSLILPHVLKAGAGIDVVCFNKTGTLTGSAAKLVGMIPVHRGQFQLLQPSAWSWSRHLKQCVAVCNGIVLVKNTLLGGSSLENSLFTAVGARFLAKTAIAVPNPGSLSGSDKLTILKAFEYSSTTHKSGALVMAPEGRGVKGLDEIVPRWQKETARAAGRSALLFLKGAPEVIKGLVRPMSVPPDFDQVVSRSNHQGLRLVALAMGHVDVDIQELDIDALTLQQAQDFATKLDLLGLKVLSNYTRTDSRETVQQLQEQGGVRTLMVTGDDRHTAVAVAREVGMLSEQGPVLVIDTTPSAGQQPIQHDPLRMPRHHADPALTPRVHSTPDRAFTRTKSSPAFTPLRALSTPAHTPGPALELGRSAGTTRANSEKSFLAPLATSHRLAPGQSKLRFQAGVEGGQGTEWGAVQAITAMAEGQVQCAVTGDAFEQLLQQTDPLLLSAVMRTAVVFAGMKPHQKAQVVHLLNKRGLHRHFEQQTCHIPGLNSTVMFCGDGVNDLEALAAADVGFVISAGDAVAAAAISSSNPSVKGVCTFIRTSKTIQALMMACFKYMVVYQCIAAAGEATAFFINGSQLGPIQNFVLDVQAVTLSFAFCLVPPKPVMTPSRPPPQVSNPTDLILIAQHALLVSLTQLVIMWYLTGQAWYQQLPTTQDAVSSLSWIVTNSQLLVPMLGLVVEALPYCQGPFSYKPLVLLATGYTSLGALFLFQPSLSGLALFPFPFSFRCNTCAILGACHVTSLAVTFSVRWGLQMYRQRKVNPEAGAEPFMLSVHL